MNRADEVLIEKCRRLEEDLAQTWGDFVLFGLFEREETAVYVTVIIGLNALSHQIRWLDYA